MADPKITVHGDSKGAVQALARLERQVDNLEGKLKRAGKTGSSSAKKMATSFTGLQLSMASAFAIGGAAAGKFFQIVVQGNRLAQADLSETIKKVSTLREKLDLQAGLTPAQGAATTKKLVDSLLKTPATDISGGLRISRQLESSGIKGGLAETLQVLAAAGATGEDLADPRAAVKSIAQFLKASGSGTEGKDVLRVGRKVQRLIRGTDVEFSDLGALAKASASLTPLGISESEQIAAFSILRDKLAPAEAGTGLRNFGTLLASASGDKAKTAALKSLGLTPSQVDFIGESLPQVLETLGTAADKADPKTRQDALIKIFGRENLAAGNILLAGRGLLTERVAAQADVAGFEADVAKASGTRTARGLRANIRKEAAQIERDKLQGGVTSKEATDALATARAEALSKGDILSGLKIAAEETATFAVTTAADFVNLSPKSKLRAQELQAGGVAAGVRALAPIPVAIVAGAVDAFTGGQSVNLAGEAQESLGGQSVMSLLRELVGLTKKQIATKEKGRPLRVKESELNPSAHDEN